MSKHDITVIVARVYNLNNDFVGVIEKTATGKLQVVLDAPWEDKAAAINHNISTDGKLPFRHKLVTVAGSEPDDIKAIAQTIAILSERLLRVIISQ